MLRAADTISIAGNDLFSLVDRVNSLKYIKEWNSSHVVSHGAIMKGYLLVTNEMMNDLDKLKEYQLESCEYVKTLAPK